MKTVLIFSSDKNACSSVKPDILLDILCSGGDDDDDDDWADWDK